MRAILSTELPDKFKNYTVLHSFKEVKEHKDSIDTLIIHSFPESPFEVGVFLSELYEDASIEHYICISSDTPVTLKVLLQSVQGQFFTDEFYFDDEDELDALIEEIEENNNTESLTKAPFEVITDFMQGFVRGESRIKTPVVMERTQAAINELQDITHKQQTDLVTYSETASDIFRQASDIIRNMDDTRKALTQQVEELEQTVSKASLGGGSVFSSEISFFNPYKYMKSLPTLILIRELVPCRYLTSFVLSYAHYLHYEKNRKVKTIFVVPKSHGIYKKFEDFTFITQDNAQISSLYEQETVVVNYPTREVLRELTEFPSDVIIVVDRLYGKTDIVDGKVHKIYAASSMADAEKFDIDPNSCIFPIEEYEDSLLTIQPIVNFPADTDARFAAYARVFEDKYKELDARFGLLNN